MKAAAPAHPPRRARRDWLLPLLIVPAAMLVLWQELRPPRPEPPAPQRTITLLAQPQPVAAAMKGPLTLTGVLRLTSPDPAMGGLSGLAALPDGRLLAISDAGQWLMLRPQIRAGRLVGVADARMGGIGLPPGPKAMKDSEAIAFTPGGETLVSLEQRHRIMRFAGIGPPTRPLGTLVRTATLAWAPNGGGEALAVLPGGALLWISELSLTPQGEHQALLIAPDGATRRIGIARTPGFAATDAALLDDGRLLLLERRFNGVDSAAALRLVDLAPLAAGGTRLPSRPLARWGAGDGWPTDNMEGLAVRREAGQTVLYLVSDDNFSALQASLLFRLVLAVQPAS